MSKNINNINNIANKILNILVFGMGLVGVSGCVTYTIVPHSPAQPTNQHEMLNLINQARSQARKCGGQFMPAVPPLQWNTILEQSAQAHANDMAKNDYFQHNSLDGREPTDRMKQAGYVMQNRFFMTAENIAGGDESANQVIESWLKSSGHCKNLMNPKITEVGMAVASKMGTKYTNYWVQNFGTR